MAGILVHACEEICPAQNRAMPLLHSPDMDVSSDVAGHVEALARCALSAIETRYPHKLDHLILHERDQPLPSQTSSTT
jgi:hypothetical protein